LQNAFALTVHKTQSLTLRDITVSLDGSLFSSGKAYTSALSRGTSLSGLSIMNLDREAFLVDEDAVRECERLQRIWAEYMANQEMHRT
jgi:hypothetical protein